MGWQIERDYDEEQKKKAAARAARAAAGGDPDAEDADNPFLIKEQGEDEDGLPFACHLCREPFKTPVQTLCGHYFCEECAVRQFGTSQACAICAKPTHGIFNPATKLLARIKATAAAPTASDVTTGSGDELHEGEQARTSAPLASAAPAPVSTGSAGAPRARKPASSGWEVVPDEPELPVSSAPPHVAPSSTTSKPEA